MKMDNTVDTVTQDEDNLVQSVKLYTPRNWLFRKDILPFVVFYAVGFALCLGSTTQFGEENFEFYRYLGLIGFPIGLSIHLVLFLLCQWSAEIRCSVGNVSAKINSATLAHVIAAKNAGSDRLVKIDRLTAEQYNTVKEGIEMFGKTFKIAQYFLEFQKLNFGYDGDSQSFVRMSYPTCAPLSQYLSWKGHPTEKQYALSLFKWGANEFDIPLPSFLDLYVTHLTAPFFVFQVICLFLWSLDDYWYYSVFTLLMLMFFEGMMCRQRQNSLTMLRNMRRPPVEILVYRCSQWARIESDQLVPGDVISLTSDIAPLHRSKRRQQSDGSDAPAAAEERVVLCDALLVQGSCVVNEAMLTGESVPQMKESPLGGKNAEDIIMDLGNENTAAEWKRHIVYSGTSLLLHTTTPSPNSAGIPPAPDGGCLAIVLRTGYGTTQGALMRKILFATERVIGGSAETFYFIGVLVIFAIIAASVVLAHGLADEKRNKFRLVLHCIMIITSVVPPELPMELSLAVTHSLAALARSLVYCTEPFRIAFAGKLNVLCFDKTGTLTKDQMILRGVVDARELPLFWRADGVVGDDSDSNGGESGPVGDMMEPTGTTNIASLVMGACHDLMVQNRGDTATKGIQALAGQAAEVPNLVGDPLEIVTMVSSGFKFDQAAEGTTLYGNKKNGHGTRVSTRISNAERGLDVELKQKYYFTSALKRMSVVASLKKSGTSNGGSSSGSGEDAGVLLLTKGAPEVLVEFLAEVPANYHSTYLLHMSKGKRVLAMAYKRLDTSTTRRESDYDWATENRADIESNLVFVGFLVFDCDLKIDSRSVVRELKSSNHKVVMITGDSVYTAADVARKLAIISKKGSSSSGETDRKKEKAIYMPALVLHAVSTSSDKGGTDLVWRGLEKLDLATQRAPEDIDFELDSIGALADRFALCVTGSALRILEDEHAPLGHPYMLAMQSLCPVVTIFARVSPTQKEAIILALNDAGEFTLMCGDGTNDVGALKAAHVGVSIVNDPEFEKKLEKTKDSSDATGKDGKGKASSKDRMARAVKELQEQEQDPTVVKLGDASIASPFTARRTSIDSVLTVIRQGRCTLVTTIQVYKILALNCLVSAYMMSALYLRGLKQGDSQMTISGLVIAALFFFLSMAKPLQKISDRKPPSSIFAKSVAMSIIGQFAVHFCSLLATLYICEQHMSENDFSLSADGKFQPNVVNSSVFLLSLLMQINNFVVNYRGHPFTQAISDNKILWRSIQGLYVSMLVVAGGQVEPLNDLLQMAKFPSPEFQASLVGILVFNFAAATLVEKASQRFE